MPKKQAGRGQGAVIAPDIQQVLKFVTDYPVIAPCGKLFVPRTGFDREAGCRRFTQAEGLYPGLSILKGAQVASVQKESPPNGRLFLYTQIHPNHVQPGR